MDDLVATWKACDGCCAVSGLPFNLLIVGDGQAKRPFAPSLDRIDRHKPYQRDNVRLVVSIANFAMNAWGVEPLLQLATAVHTKHGDRAKPTKSAPADADLDSVAVIDNEFVETNIGTLTFPPRLDMHRPILHLLKNGPLSSRNSKMLLRRGLALQRTCVPLHFVMAVQHGETMLLGRSLILSIMNEEPAKLSVLKVGEPRTADRWGFTA